MTTLSSFDLNSLAIFDAVAESGGFTAAADRLGVAKAKVSVQISRLERQLGTSLFTRTTRQVSLTDAGRALHLECQPLLRSIQEALAQAGSDQGELTGLLRLSTTVSHAEQSLAPAVARFAAMHPALQIDLRTADRVTDLVAEGIDLSIRLGWLKDSSLRAIKLGEFDQYVVASPSYLDIAGRPKRPEDLSKHAWITLSLLPAPNTWKFTSRLQETSTVHVKSRIVVDAPGALLSLVRHGAGISVLEKYNVEAGLDAGELVRLLPGWSLPRGGIHAVLPPGHFTPKKTRAFIDFYKNFLARR
ncbi:LysR family transcriptional regulator [soil metagenome]